MKWVPFGVFSTSHFDFNQHRTINDNKNPPGIMKTRPGVIKNQTWSHKKYEKPPGTMKNHLEP